MHQADANAAAGQKPLCLLVQPVHPIGVASLEAAGFTVRLASGFDMATVAEEIADADMVLTRDAGVNAAAMARAPKVRVIGNHGAGVNNVALDEATRLGIAVVNTPGANSRSVAEHAIALMLAVARRIPGGNDAARQGNWRFRFDTPMHDVHGKVLGVVGYGAIGRTMADIARQGFGMRVVVWSPSVDAATRAALAVDGVTFVDSLAALLTQADVVSLHRPVRADTRHMINAEALAMMKSTAILINTSRGALIDEAALAEALLARRIFGAGLDVFEHEPLATTSPLAALPEDVNLVCAPHTGGSTQEALIATVTMCVEQMLSVWRDETPPHLVNPDVWDKRRR